MNAIEELQGWYAAQCNGDWEHMFGIRIESMDNPGWHVEIEIAGTTVGGETAPLTSEKGDDWRDWIEWESDGGTFRGAGGPLKLEEIIRKFLGWVKATQGSGNLSILPNS